MCNLDWWFLELCLGHCEVKVLELNPVIAWKNSRANLSRAYSTYMNAPPRITLEVAIR